MNMKLKYTEGNRFQEIPKDLSKTYTGTVSEICYKYSLCHYEL